MFKAKDTVLVVIDVQGRLASLMPDSSNLFHNIRRMIKAAQILNVPILWTEQVPEKIGVTVPEIAELLPKLKPIRKVTFSCCGEKKFMDALKGTKRKNVILIGIEAHVCVYQTAADLIREKFKVQVVVDAVSSRNEECRLVGLERIKQLGGEMTNVEMVACELLEKAEGQKFKEILQMIK